LLRYDKYTVANRNVKGVNAALLGVHYDINKLYDAAMKHISILVPKGAAVLACIEGSLKLLNIANTFLESEGKLPAFKVQLVGLTREPQSMTNVLLSTQT
jgi:hypothetical protein